MRGACLLSLVAVLCLAQRGRDDYRAAYTAWRQTDPTLEKEASAGGAPIAQRADRMAAEAAKSAAARKAFLDGTTLDQSHQIAWLDNAAVTPEPAAADTRADSQFFATESARVARTIETFA